MSVAIPDIEMRDIIFLRNKETHQMSVTRIYTEYLLLADGCQ